MPKDRIDGTDASVMIGWGREQADVQVGVGTQDGKSLLWTLYGDDDKRTQIGKTLVFELGLHDQIGEVTSSDEYNQRCADLTGQVLNIVESAGWSSVMAYESFWVTLSRRSQINDLIKLLRRARDAAFGKDE